MASYNTNNNACFDVDIKELKIASLNVRGLKNTIKQSAIVNSLKSLNIDIICLQDTHLIQIEENNLKLEWSGPCFFAEGTNNSKGMCIMFNKDFMSNQISIIYKNDRVLLCSLNIGAETFFICNIYAPNEVPHKKLFYRTLISIIRDNLDEQQQKHLFLVGDFNCVMNNSLDVISGHPHSVDAVKCLNQATQDLELIDVWRKHNKTEKNYTWSGGNPVVARRIDFIFSNRYLTPFLNDCNIMSIGHTDHRLVYCEMKFYKFKKGKGTFKMNDSLFLDPVFKNTMSKLITTNKEELKDEDPILKWNIIKSRVKELAQQYGKYNKLERTNKIECLRNELNFSENQLAKRPEDEKVVKIILDLKKKIRNNEYS